MAEALAAAVSELVEAPLLSLSADELTAELREDFACTQQLSARILALVHQASLIGVPSAQGASSTGVWLAETVGMSMRAATAWVKLADRLPSVPVLADALAAGTVNAEQAQVIAATVADLPAEVGGEGACAPCSTPKPPPTCAPPSTRSADPGRCSTRAHTATATAQQQQPR